MTSQGSKTRRVKGVRRRSPPRVDADGVVVCRFCGGRIVEARRRTFCSAVCVHNHKMQTSPRYVRQQVAKRDRGVCKSCGVNTRKRDRAVRLAVELAVNAVYREHRALSKPELVALADAATRQALEAFGMRKLSDLGWQADHILPVAEGGGLMGLQNYQTLCTLCHHVKTAEQAKRRAASRKKTRA